MICAARIGNADTDDYDAKEWRRAQRDSRAMKIIGGMKRQLVDTGIEGLAGDERSVGAARCVRRDCGDQASLDVRDEMQLDGNTVRRYAASDIEYVS